MALYNIIYTNLLKHSNIISCLSKGHMIQEKIHKCFKKFLPVFLIIQLLSFGLQQSSFAWFKKSSLDKGLVGHWDLAQASLKSSTTIADKTPNSNTGTLVGSPTFTTDQHGQANQAMSFNGSSQIISISSSSVISPTTAITVSMWVKPNTGYGSAGNPGIISKRSSWGGIWVTQSNGYLWGRVYQSGGGQVNLPASSLLPVNQWSHIVLTANPSNGKVSEYLNGALASTPQNYDGTLQSGTDSLLIAQQLSEYFNGSIVDIRVYNRALSAAEISQLYNSYRPKVSAGSLNKGLVGYWPLDQQSLKSSTVAADKTPNSNTGTFVGSPTFTTDQHGQANKATRLNLNTDYITTTFNPSSLTSFTVSMWIKAANNNNPFVFGGYDGSSNNKNFYIRILTWDSIFFGVGGGYYQLIESGSSVYGWSSWNHIVCTWNGTIGKVYLKGIERGVSASGSPSGNFFNFALPIGTGFSAANTPITGTHETRYIADVRVYNRALSSTEVQALYQSYE